MDDANDLRSRAEQARIKAEKIADAECKRMILGIADMYDELARWAERCRALNRGSTVADGIRKRGTYPSSVAE
jgi:hypothetical protein